MIYCEKCKGTNVQAMAWVDVNTFKFYEWTEDNDYWCNDCDEFVDITEEEIE